MTARRAPTGGGSAGGGFTVVEVSDERDRAAAGALDLIELSFPRADRQPVAELRSEIAEKRLGLLAAMDFHLLAAIAPDGEVAGTSAGLYLEGVNAGFVTYLAVAAGFRGRRLGPLLRSSLVETFRADARRAGYDELAWVLGEVRADSPWLRRLLDRRAAIVFDLEYLHPGMRPGDGAPAFVLYRQPVGDARVELPAEEVRRVLYAIYRRGYRVRYPLQHPAFASMLEQLEEDQGPEREED